MKRGGEKGAPTSRHEAQEKAKLMRSQNRKYAQSAKMHEDGEHRVRAVMATTADDDDGEKEKKNQEVVVEANLNQQREQQPPLKEEGKGVNGIDVV